MGEYKMSGLSIKGKKALTNMVANGGNLAKAMRDAGYSARTARSPQKLTNQPEFKKEALSFIQKLEKERDRLIEAISKKNLGKVQYEGAVRSVDLITKNMQLLSGNATERSEVNIENKDKVKNAIKGIIG